jgi:hypothetical protein
MEINKEFLVKVIDFKYCDSLGTSEDGVSFYQDKDNYSIDVTYNSNGVFTCEIYVGENVVDLDDETFIWLLNYAEKSLDNFHEEMWDYDKKREIALDYFMSSNFEKY